MKLIPLLALSSAVATSLVAEETRQLDAHEHGVGQLNIAVDGPQIAMELHAPGADIVGFEYAAETAKDRAAVDTAVATLARPLDLFVLPEAAGCSVVQAAARLESEEAHEDHDHEHADGHDAHKEHEHAADGHDDHQHEQEHADEHDAHKEHEHAAEGHDDHAEHEDHAGEASHTEFHAEYLLTCADPAAVTSITFAYFDTFPNALEVEVQMVTDAGATSFEVERDAPTLDLKGMF